MPTKKKPAPKKKPAVKKAAAKAPARSATKTRAKLNAKAAKPKAAAKTKRAPKPANGVAPGMHSITPHLVCAGAAEAMDFYKKAFGAVEEMRAVAPVACEAGSASAHIAFMASAISAGLTSRWKVATDH